MLRFLAVLARLTRTSRYHRWLLQKAYSGFLSSAVVSALYWAPAIGLAFLVDVSGDFVFEQTSNQLLRYSFTLAQFIVFSGIAFPMLAFWFYLNQIGLRRTFGFKSAFRYLEDGLKTFES